MNWSSRPFVRIFFPLVAGIYLTYRIPFFGESAAVWAIILTGSFSLGAYVFYRKNRSWKWRWANGVLFVLAIMSAGIFLTSLKLTTDTSFLNGHKAYYVAEVVSEPVRSEKSVKMILKLERMVSNDTIIVNGSRVMAFFRSDSLSRKLQYGDVVVFKGSLHPPVAPKNPDEFDYASFLALHNVYARVFLQQDDWSLLGRGGNPVYIIAAQTRNYLLRALQENGLTGNNYTVAAAVLLGYDQLMDPELEQDYVTAGAMHILCVSGLHVGIIYLVLNYILGFLKRNKTQKIIKVVLLLILIWFYALLTGLSPSVLRSSVMISLFIIATLMARYKDVYNTLAASAVLLLLFDPLLLFNVGFQLSYTAVLSILMFYQPIYSIIYFRNKAADKIWSVVAVSTAAQLGTFPLAAHYFHFFPPYFWLTNIFIFPLSFAIIGTGMAFMVFSWAPVVSGILGILLSAFVFLLNYIVGMVKYLPLNGIHDLYYPWLKVVLMYALILLAVPLLLQSKVKRVIPALVVILLLVSFNTLHKYQVLKQKRMVVYSIRGHGVYDFISGNKHVLLADSALLAAPNKLDFHLENSRIGWGLEKNNLPVAEGLETAPFDFFYNGQFGIFGPYTFMIWDGNKFYPTSQVMQLDFVIAAGRGNPDLKSLKEAIVFDSLIIDSSVPHWKLKKLSGEAESLNISYFDVNRQGAFIAEIGE